MMTSAFRFLATGAVALLCCSSGAQAADRSAEYSAILEKSVWQSAVLGVQRLTVDEPAVLTLLAFQYGPRSRDTLDYVHVVSASDPRGGTAIDMLDEPSAFGSLYRWLVINGGYFDRAPDGTLSPTGLLIADGKMLATLTACRACSGVLYTAKGKPGLEITWAAGFKVTADITSAFQTGPLLVEPGGKLGISTPGGPLAERSAICLSESKEITVVAVTSRVTLYELATLLQSPAPGGFGCDVAINLDGGPSTQVATTLSKPRVIGTHSPVQNFVVFDRIVPWWF